MVGTDQRYYAVGMGRFNTPDPSGLSAVVRTNPTSWNRCSYVNSDPVNFNDRSGRRADPVGACGTDGGQTLCDLDNGAGGADGGATLFSISTAKIGTPYPCPTARRRTSRRASA